MGKICKKSWIAGIFLGVMLFAAGFAFQATTIDAQAASTGFRTVGGQTFYYKKGKKVKGWVTVKGKEIFPEQKDRSTLQRLDEKFERQTTLF